MWIVVIAFAVLAGAAVAEVKPHGLFSDNCVLQHGMSVPVWGTADSDEKVRVEFQGQKVSCVTKDGKWIVRLRPLKPGGPFAMKINDLEIKNVLVGEVWVCGGQSNMQFGLSSCAGGKDAIAGSADSELRLVNMESKASGTPLCDLKDKWVECGPQTVGGFSGVGYFFGRDLRKALKTPVGLIDSAIGGTLVQAWTSRKTLGLPDDPNYTETGRNEMNQPSVFYNAMIHPLLPFAIRGVIWYQGESNAGEAFRYETLFSNMIRDWRQSWGEGDFPFLFVQLAPYGAIVDQPRESAWAELREAQFLTSRSVPNTGMAVITDFGHPGDIHPIWKEPVGARLALAARALVYGEKLVHEGPVFKSMEVKDNRAVLTFDNVGSGLEAKGGDLTGFAVAGEDHKYHNARALIVRDKVLVSATEVSKPVAVRFGWADCPVVNLFNKDGMPACPFRTDDFPMVTAPK